MLDFIDERFNLYVRENGSVATLSSEFIKTGFMKNLPADGRLVKSGSDEFFSLWDNGWEQLVAQLESQGRLDRLFINRVHWAESAPAGAAFPGMYADPAFIQKANATLNRLYERVARDIPQSQFIDHAPDVMRADASHKWGLSPFHYVDEYYVRALKRLQQLKG